jgi:hypothetical protein
VIEDRNFEGCKKCDSITKTLLTAAPQLATMTPKGIIRAVR